MKPRILVPGVVLIVLCVVAFFVYRGPAPDPPTRATGPDQLAADAWPSDNLPALFTPQAPRADATQLMVRCLDYYNDHPSLGSDAPDPGQVAALADLLVQAMQRGQVRDGFLDAYLDVDYGSQPRFGQALEGIATVGLDQAHAWAQQGQIDQANQLNCAVWALGQRAYAHNVLLYPRYTGLQIMMMAGQQRFELLGPDDAQVQELAGWALALQAIVGRWEAKLPLVAGVAPHPGDLVNLARHDQERTFRIAGTLQLGIAKFNARHRGNLRAIQAAIDAGRRSDDPLIADAAGKADRLTADELHRIR